MPLDPLTAIRQRNAAKGLPPKVTPAQRGGIIGGAIITAVLAAVYVNEGGYSNHFADRGGETNFGVTASVAQQFGYRGSMRNFPKHCDAQNPICADLIYKTNYIDKPGYRPMAAIEPAVLFELVDSAVLHGPPRGSGWFQQSLNELCDAGLVVDKQVGPKTIAAYQACQQRVGKTRLCFQMLDRLDAKQRAFFDAIVARNPSQKVFYRGWIKNRIGNVKRIKCADWTA